MIELLRQDPVLWVAIGVVAGILLVVATIATVLFIQLRRALLKMREDGEAVTRAMHAQEGP